MLKKNGLAKVNHHPSITEEDLKKLYESEVFSLDNPVSLQHKVFFEVMLHFCRRGRENLRTLTVHDFALKKTVSGVDCFVKVTDELSKNHRENDENEEQAIMLATGNANCPVRSFKLYVSKLNKNLPTLFQRTKRTKPVDGPWYDNMVLGIKKLDSMMKLISTEAVLSTIYTNHSIRATAITILDANGVEARHIMSLSGHRFESSVRSYCKTSDSRKRDISSLLSRCSSGCSSSSSSSKSSSKQQKKISPHIVETQLKQQQIKLAKKFNINSPNFVPNFNTGLESPVKMAPIIYGQNVYNNCTFIGGENSMNRMSKHKYVSERIRIESDSESSQEQEF